LHGNAYIIVEVVWFTGATRDLGSGLTRFCLRHRNLEGKLRTLCRQYFRIDSNLFIIIIIIVVVVVVVVVVEPGTQFPGKKFFLMSSWNGHYFSTSSFMKLSWCKTALKR